MCTSCLSLCIFSSLLILSVGHFSNVPSKRGPEGTGWDELHDPVSVRVQHRPHQSCRCLAHWSGGTAILETQHRDHCEYEELKSRTNTAKQFRKQGLLLWFLWEILKQNTLKFDIFEQTVHLRPALDCYHVFPSITGSSSPHQACHGCEKVFAEAERKHHCRSCGEGFCHPCSSHRMPVPERGWGSGPVRVCKACYRQGGPADTNSQGETPPTNQWMYKKWS